MTTELMENLQIQTFESIEKLIENLNGSYEEGVDVLEQLEANNTDFQFFVDENLDALTDYLKDAGFTQEQINWMASQHYGYVVDFYQIKQDQSSYYLMALGSR